MATQSRNHGRGVDESGPEDGFQQSIPCSFICHAGLITTRDLICFDRVG